MYEKIKSQINFIVHNITDIRVLGQVVFGLLILLVSWSCVKAIQTNADLQKQIAILEQQNDVKELEKQNLELKNQYFTTDQYLELAARRQFGKAAPGEKVLIVPKSVALSSTVELPKTAAKTKVEGEVRQPFYEENLEAWRNFFFRRND